VQPGGIKRVNREAMCVSRGARNPVTPCPSRIIAVYQRSGLYSYMQTCRVCQIWKDGLDVMGFRAWRETPGLSRRQRMAWRLESRESAVLRIGVDMSVSVTNRGTKQSAGILMFINW
jgi:hypothetical protein